MHRQVFLSRLVRCGELEIPVSGRLGARMGLAPDFNGAARHRRGPKPFAARPPATASAAGQHERPSPLACGNLLDAILDAFMHCVHGHERSPWDERLEKLLVPGETARPDLPIEAEVFD